VKRAWRVLSEHRVFVVVVALLFVKQAVASWLLIGRPVTTPNLVVALVGEGLFLVAPLFALRGWRRIAGVVAVDLFVSCVIVADLAYNRHFNDLPSVALLRHAGQVARVEGAATALLRPVDLLFLFSGLVVVAALLPRRRLADAPSLAPRRALALAALGFALATTVALTSASVRNPVGMRIRIANRLGPFGYHLHDIASHLSRSLRSRLIDKDRLVEEAIALADDREGARRETPAHRWNVVVVQMEALQGYAFGRTVGGVPVTPNLDRLAAESLRFPRFFSQVAQGSTADAELLAQCSLQPSRVGAVFFEYAGTRFRCLPELLQRAGWTTVAMHANDPEFWGRATTYPAIGFGTFHDVAAFSRNDDIGMGPSDAVFFSEAVEKLRKTPEPYYAVLLSLSSHMPFVKVRKIPAVLDHGRFQDTWVGYHLDGIRYADAALGRLIDGLRSDGSLDRTILVVYGDHWGSNRFNSNLGDYLGIRASDSARWFVAERSVPLLVRVPGMAAREVGRTAGQIDLAPTIAGLLGLPRTRAIFLGRDLLDGGPGRVAFASGAGADDEHLYLSSDAGAGTEGCYRLGSLERVAIGSCREIKAEAERELRVGWSLLDADVIARAGDERARRAAAAGETASRPTTVPLPR